MRLCPRITALKWISPGCTQKALLSPDIYIPTLSWTGSSVPQRHSNTNHGSGDFGNFPLDALLPGQPCLGWWMSSHPCHSCTSGYNSKTYLCFKSFRVNFSSIFMIYWNNTKTITLGFTNVQHFWSIINFMVFAVFSILAVSQSQFRPLPAQDVVPPTFRCQRFTMVTLFCCISKFLSSHTVLILSTQVSGSKIWQTERSCMCCQVCIQNALFQIT